MCLLESFFQFHLRLGTSSAYRMPITAVVVICEFVDDTSVKVVGYVFGRGTASDNVEMSPCHLSLGIEE